MTQAKKKVRKDSYTTKAKELAKKYQLTKGEVFVPNADFAAPRASFFATGANSPCAPTPVPDTCYGARGKKLTPKNLGVESGAAYKAACKRIKGTFVPKHLKPIRAGKVDLNFLSPAQAEKRGTLPGANLRLCLRDDEPGYLIPVASPDAAAKLQRSFAKCTGGNKAKSAACALKVAGGSAPLGNLVSPRAFSGLFGR